MANRNRVTAQLDLMPGSVVEDRYELKSLLGEGGFAVVFEAFDRQIERMVALKVLDVGLLPDEPQMRDKLLERFQREAKLAARIDHPGVVSIHDIGFIGANASNPYIVMERLEGWDLEEQIFQRGPLAPQRAMSLFTGALEALGEAHNKGIVHKDLKPGNVFFSQPRTPQESLRIVDFGVAFMENAAEGRLTHTGEIPGTPNYMTPEYINEQIATPALDVYQMALILIETLSGKRVVHGSTPMRCLYMHITGSLEIPRGLVESDLGPVLESALAMDHERRFANGHAFANALRTIDPSRIPNLGAGEVSVVRPLSDRQVADTRTDVENMRPGGADESGQTMLGLGEVEDFDSDRFINEARRTGTLSAKQTSRLLELDSAYTQLSSDQIKEETPSTSAPAPAPATNTGSEPEWTGPADGASERAPSMWEFTGAAYAGEQDAARSGEEASVEFAAPSSSGKTVRIILGIALVLAAVGVFAFILLGDAGTDEQGDDAKVVADPQPADEPANERGNEARRAESDARGIASMVADRTTGMLAAQIAADSEPAEARAGEPEGASDDNDREAPEPQPEAAERRPARAGESPEPDRPAPKKSLWVGVESTPAGAIVTTEGKLVGRTPCKVKFEPGEQSQTIKLEKDGFETRSVRLEREDYPARSVSLVAEPQAAAAPEPQTDDGAGGTGEDQGEADEEEDDGLEFRIAE